VGIKLVKLSVTKSWLQLKLNTLILTKVSTQAGYRSLPLSIRNVLLKADFKLTSSLNKTSTRPFHTLERPDFALDPDLDHLLQDYKKQLQPELPETASGPIHLHNLFQEVFVEMNTSQSKPKGRQKLAKGLQA
jgi:hypothetical protein